MNNNVFIFLLLLSSVGFSQKNQNWKNTFLYGFQLPDALENYAGIYATIRYNGEPLISKSVKMGGKSVHITSEPFYVFDKSASVGTVKLPFKVPGKTYYWLLDGAMLTEMALHPNRYQITVTTTNAEATKRYQLPETFDCISENGLNVAYLQSFTPIKRHQMLQEKIWKLNVEEKEKFMPEFVETIRDTTLTFSLRNPIPKGILMALPELNQEAHSTQEFIIAHCYFIANTFLIPVKSKTKVLQNHPDASYGNYTTLQGTVCSTNGGITGTGTGLCSQIKTSRNKINYQLTLLIEP